MPQLGLGGKDCPKKQMMRLPCGGREIGRDRESSREEGIRERKPGSGREET
jgi:hypothetical protein